MLTKPVASQKIWAGILFIFRSVLLNSPILSKTVGLIFDVLEPIATHGHLIWSKSAKFEIINIPARIVFDYQESFCILVFNLILNLVESGTFQIPTPYKLPESHSNFALWEIVWFL